MADYYVYILTNKPRGTLYVGVTNDLVGRSISTAKVWWPVSLKDMG
jgi:predicted GIY-YIG superfamily endonuclease